MGCKIQYIKDKYKGVELDIVSSLHQQIEKELYDPGILHKFKGAYYEFVNNGGSNVGKINASRRKMGEINDKYGKVITILPTREYRINVLPIATEYIRKYLGQSEIDFNTNPQITAVGKKNEQLDILLKEFATINGIKVEYFDTLLDKYKGDYTAVFNSVKRTIDINNSKEGKDTLSEEVAHSVVEALGDDNALVKRALNLIPSSFKSTLDPEYIKIYKGNEIALKKEYLGKLIAETLVHKFEPKDIKDINLLDAILKLVNRFISLFKTNDRVTQIQDIVDQLVDKIVNKERIVPTSSTTPVNTLWFQINSKKSIDPNYKKQYVYFDRRKKELKKSLSKQEVDTPRYNEITAELKKISKSLEELTTSGNKQIIIDLADELLNNLENKFIDGLETGKIPTDKIKADDMIYAVDTLDAFKDFAGLSDRSLKLYNRLEPFIEQYALTEINEYATEDFEITKENVIGQSADINRLVKSFGALADLGNYIARTIGSIIKAAQNRVSTKNKQAAEDIKKHVDKLKDWAKSNNISTKDMYNVFIQKYKGSTILTRKYTTEWYDLVQEKIHDNKDKSWKNSNAIWNPMTRQWEPINGYLNENYITIHKDPVLKEFYYFHKELTKEAATKIPKKVLGGENFIANIKKDSLLDILKDKDKKILHRAKGAISNITNIDSKEFDNKKLVADEELYEDVVPVKYTKSLDPKEKSTDLGENLLTFISFVNSYEEMSEVLPKVRLLQEQIKNRKTGYTRSSKPNEAISGENTNLYKMVDDYIKMQVKGQMKNEEFKIGKKVYDEDGNVVSEKYVHLSDVVDFGLKYNSLLRIGLNPFNAFTNVLIGDIGNIVEGFGGRYYNMKELAKATNIYTKYAMSNKDTKAESDLHSWLEKLNPLQELEDYENVNKVSVANRVTTDKVKSFMYAPQRIGENFLQTRTMLAILIHDGYMTPEGVTTEKGQNLDELQIGKLSDKVQRINQMIHGRYSARDAATVQQSVLWRMAIQFKKWIPAAIEARVQNKHYDNRLGMEVEGRYHTWIKGWNNMTARLFSDHEKLKRNEFSELDKYNMRKNITEVIIMATTILMFYGLGWTDDKKKKKNPYYKFAMNQLDRVSGDMLFFYSPEQANRNLKSPFALIKTTGDLIQVIENIPYIFIDKKSVYTKGPHKGENKFLGKLIDITPGAKPLADVIRLGKKVPYQNTQKQN